MYMHTYMNTHAQVAMTIHVLDAHEEVNSSTHVNMYKIKFQTYE